MELPINQIICGDVFVELRKLPNDHIDSVVTDPPYNLNFMNKIWDRTGITFDVNLWREVLRVLKPGGHLLSFGGARVYHRMTCAIEDAGFEIRDCLMWVYGCLSEDTEILTIKGWERYHKNIANNPVLCYNIDKEKFEFHKPLNFFIYENKYPAYRIQSDKTDQIVSRNHRVLVERGGKFIFQRAETLEQQENIPFLESLSDLPESIYDFQSYTSIKKSDLFARMSEQTFIQNKQREEAKRNNLPNVSGEILSNRTKFGKTPQILFKTLCRQIKNLVERIWISWQSWLDRKKPGKLSGKNGWSRESSLERWCNLFQKTRELSTNKICEMSKRIFVNGSQRRLCYGASAIDGTEIKQTAFENRSSPPYQSQSTGQQNRKFTNFSHQSSPQTIRITKAKITPIKYKDKVWCVEVPTGAFIARRKGKIFITGNSGFPKGLNIGKKIEQWQGWGTTLKPTVEPIVLARKPISEKNIAENVLKWGTGGINIDRCRVSDGRFPANLIHDGSDEVVELFPNSTARFFYCPKANTKERNLGLESLPDKPAGFAMRNDNFTREHMGNTPAIKRNPVKNDHPTVKPISLMRYLCRLITPPNGVVLDPFVGSGSTAIACKLEGFKYIGIDISKSYCELAQKRLDAVL